MKPQLFNRFEAACLAAVVTVPAAHFVVGWWRLALAAAVAGAASWAWRRWVFPMLP